MYAKAHILGSLHGACRATLGAMPTQVFRHGAGRGKAHGLRNKITVGRQSGVNGLNQPPCEDRTLAGNFVETPPDSAKGKDHEGLFRAASDEGVSRCAIRGKSASTTDG